jgi:integrase
MAAIRKLPSGKWNVQVRRFGHKAISRSFVLERDALRWAREIESDLDRGTFQDRTKTEATTFGDALARYLEEITPLKKGSKQEAQRIKAWLKHPLADRSIAFLRAKDFAEFRDKRTSQGVATNTIRLELALISHMFNIARKEWGLALQNPVAAIRMPCGSSARERRFEGNEGDRLLESCRNSKSKHLYPLVVLALETAMRLGELLKLTWNDFDENAKVLTLRETKNGKMRRVPLSSVAFQTLLEIPRSHSNARIFFSWSTRPDSIKTAWRGACSRANLIDFRFHDLRHEATSRLCERGLSPVEVASITGHRNLGMLLRYAHMRPENLVQKLK